MMEVYQKEQDVNEFIEIIKKRAEERGYKISVNKIEFVLEGESTVEYLEFEYSECPSKEYSHWYNSRVKMFKIE